MGQLNRSNPNGNRDTTFDILTYGIAPTMRVFSTMMSWQSPHLLADNSIPLTVHGSIVVACIPMRALRSPGSDPRSDPIRSLIGSLISRQLTISRSDRIPRTTLLPSDHDPGDPARYVERCWIRNFIKTIGHFISNITIVKIHKLPENIHWNMVGLVSTVCIFSLTLITYTYLSNMACPNRVVSWANIVCVHWTGHDALELAIINDVATTPIGTSWIYIASLTLFIQSRPRNFTSKFHNEWFMSRFNLQ